MVHYVWGSEGEPVQTGEGVLGIVELFRIAALAVGHDPAPANSSAVAK